MTIYHNYLKRPLVKAEKLKKGSNVDASGYKSIETRIKEMTRCGQRLIASRSNFDIPEGSEVNEDDVQIDPTRRPGFDLADASTYADDLNTRHKRARAEKKASDKAGKDGVGEKQFEKTDGGKKELATAESGDKKDNK